MLHITLIDLKILPLFKFKDINDCYPSLSIKFINTICEILTIAVFKEMMDKSAKEWRNNQILYFS